MALIDKLEALFAQIAALVEDLQCIPARSPVVILRAATARVLTQLRAMLKLLSTWLETHDRTDPYSRLSMVVENETLGGPPRGRSVATGCFAHSAPGDAGGFRGVFG